MSHHFCFILIITIQGSTPVQFLIISQLFCFILHAIHFVVMCILAGSGVFLVQQPTYFYVSLQISLIILLSSILLWCILHTVPVSYDMLASSHSIPNTHANFQSLPTLLLLAAFVVLPL